ncbi:MAG: hypothetical protein ABJE95_26045 [Byssovorax sp.]
MPPQDASEELPSSPGPSSVHDRVTSRMPQDALVEAAAAAMPRCPRCGGRGEPRRRAPSRLNPFLRTTPPPGQVTCDDCGLDFEHSVDAGGADSGKALWSTASTASTAAKAKDP